MPSDQYTAEAIVQTIRKMKSERESNVEGRSWLVYEGKRVKMLHKHSSYGIAGFAALMAATVEPSQGTVLGKAKKAERYEMEIPTFEEYEIKRR